MSFLINETLDDFSMDDLVDLPNPNPKYKVWLLLRRYYRLEKEYTYYSPKYDKFITVEAGVYDGATWAFDTVPVEGNPPSWLVHDQICNNPFWDDGSPISAWEAANVLSEILEANNYLIRSQTWKYATFAMGCKKARTNSWFPAK